MKTDPLRRWIARRALRETVLACVALLVAAGSLVDTYVYAPQRAQAAVLRKEVEQARRGLQKLQLLALEQTQQSDARASARASALMARRARAEGVIRNAQADLIAPQDMARQLGSILARHPELRIVSMNTQPPTPVGELAAAASATSTATLPASSVTTAAPAAAVPSTDGLYQHGLELRVEGRYLDVLNWLQALERAPHRIYWREFDLQVGPEGLPVTRIVLFTLSRESTWLRL